MVYTRASNQVEAEVKKAIDDCLGGGGFMIVPGCAIYQDTPFENINANGRAISKYGIYQN